MKRIITLFLVLLPTMMMAQFQWQEVDFEETPKPQNNLELIKGENINVSIAKVKKLFQLDGEPTKFDNSYVFGVQCKYEDYKVLYSIFSLNDCLDNFTITYMSDNDISYQTKAIELNYETNGYHPISTNEKRTIYTDGWHKIAFQHNEFGNANIKAIIFIFPITP